jgi:hypothetical protein
VTLVLFVWAIWTAAIGVAAVAYRARALKAERLLDVADEAMVEMREEIATAKLVLAAERRKLRR